MSIQRLLTIAAILALPLGLTHCASTGDPIGDGYEDLDQAVEKHLPGLGPNPSTANDAYDNDPALR